MSMNTGTKIEGSVERLENRLAEAFDSLWDNFVDPREAYFGDNDEVWMPLDGIQSSNRAVRTPSLPQLGDLREACRSLALNNEFAINGHENRISYVVGSGHTYHATIRKGIDSPVEIAQLVQREIDNFQYENQWHTRQQEVMRRLDRDGEVFIRFFPDQKGMTRVRFVEPEQVTTPLESQANPAASHGILTDENDVESVRGYFIDGEYVESLYVQHRKANVDSNVKRGLPLYAPVRSNLLRAEKLLRNMSVVAEIQSAIALIRKHRSASRSGVEQFVADRSSASTIDRQGRTRRVTEYGPGTILDAPAGLEYDFPATGIDAGSFVTILQAELRAIAARLVMPEFMFTSDASNASFSSTMVAEGPAVKMFERLQASMIEADLQVLKVVMQNAVRAGNLPANVEELVQIQVTPPSVQVRDRFQESQVDRVAKEHGVLSLQTWSRRLGLDYDQEQKNIRLHTDRDASNSEAMLHDLTD